MALIAAAFAYYRSLPNWAQLVIQWGIRAAIASFILAQWSSVATYWYAMRYGARPPVEGVPFLALTVALLGLGLMGITIILFYGVPSILTIFRASIHRKYGFMLSCLIAIIVSVPILAIIVFNISGYISQYFGVSQKFSGIFGITLMLVVQILTMYVVDNYLTDKTVSIISVCLYGVSIAALMIAMLYTPFDHILRATRFGGGVKVDVELPNKERLTGQSLFLTSANFVTVYDPATAKFRELNRDHIVQIEYSGVGGWTLPREKQYAEIFGFDDLSAGNDTAAGAVNVPNPDGQQ